MSVTFPIPQQKALAPETPVQLSSIKEPQYGRYFEHLFPGQIFSHPRGFTFERTLAQSFARAFLQSNPLYFHNDFARAHGFSYAPVHPLMTFQAVRSMLAQDITEKAISELRCTGALFLRPVYPGDVLRAMTQTVSQDDSPDPASGSTSFRTVALNQNNEVVMRYEHKHLVHKRQMYPPALPFAQGMMPRFPWHKTPKLELPLQDPSKPRSQFVRPGAKSTGESWDYLTGENTYFGDFNPGDILLHTNGKTITYDHVYWQALLGGTHPKELSAFYTNENNTGYADSNPKIPVSSGLLYALLDGLSSRDISENAVWDLGFTELYRPSEAYFGDTIFGITRILQKEEAPAPFDDSYGILTLQLLGLKNIRPHAAIQKHGAELFMPSSTGSYHGTQELFSYGPDPLPKVFEVERRILIKKKKQSG